MLCIFFQFDSFVWFWFFFSLGWGGGSVCWCSEYIYIYIYIFYYFFSFWKVFSRAVGFLLFLQFLSGQGLPQVCVCIHCWRRTWPLAAPGALVQDALPFSWFIFGPRSLPAQIQLSVPTGARRTRAVIPEEACECVCVFVCVCLEVCFGSRGRTRRGVFGTSPKTSCEISAVDLLSLHLSSVKWTLSCCFNFHFIITSRNIEKES